MQYIFHFSLFSPLKQDNETHPPGSLEVVGCEVWTAAACCRPMTTRAFAAGPQKKTGPDVSAAHSHL